VLLDSENGLSSIYRWIDHRNSTIVAPSRLCQHNIGCSIGHNRAHMFQLPSHGPYEVRVVLALLFLERRFHYPQLTPPSVTVSTTMSTLTPLQFGATTSSTTVTRCQSLRSDVTNSPQGPAVASFKSTQPYLGSVDYYKSGDSSCDTNDS
jgi:hypothetical protein